METDSRRWFFQKVDSKSRETGAKTDGKKTERAFQLSFADQSWAPGSHFLMSYQPNT